MPLGSNPNMPNLTPEVIFGVYTDGVSGAPDANPATVIADYLTNADFGAGLPVGFLGDLTVYRNYCRSIGLVVSPVIVDQAEARGFLKELLDATNSVAVWTAGKLNVIPYGDIATSGNGATYSPPGSALYSIAEIDLKPLQGSNSASKGGGSGVGPISVSLSDDPATSPNLWPVEYLERGNAYNPTVVTVQDDAAIATYGLRPASKRTLHFMCASFAATMAAELIKGRAQPKATYAFTLGQEYILLDPMDIIEINDVALGYSQKWVRITEISENADNTLTIQAEEYLLGTGGAPAFSMQVGAGFSAAVNNQPTAPFSTVIWEPSYTLAGGLEIWIAASGQADFGGAEVYVSTDNASYSLIGEITGPSRIGDLTASLASVSPAGSGLTIDTTHTLSVDMSPSGQMLIAGTHADADAANTLCFVASGGAGAGEYLAYSGATLGSGQTYALTYLNRGLFETTPVSHASGASFVRLIPGTFLRWSLTPDRIGTTFYFKVLPFNPYGGGQLSLADVTAVSYAVVGRAFANVSAGTVAIRNNTGTGWLPIGTYNPFTTIFTAPVATLATTVAPGAIDRTALASSLTPVGVIANSSSSGAGFSAGQYAVATSDHLLYRWSGGAWAPAVNTTDLSGMISDSQITTLAGVKVTGTLSDSQIAAIAAAKVTGQIVATQITDGAISTPKLAAGAVTANEIAANTITAAKVAAGTLTATELAAGAITTNKMTAGSIDANRLIANSITTGLLAAGAVTATEIASGAITTSKLSAGFALISSAQIGNLNVDTINVKAGALSYFAAEYNEYLWTPPSSYLSDGGCTVSVTVADTNEMVLIMFKTVAEYTDHAAGPVTGSTGGGGSGSNGSEAGGPG